jgi:hypothetical protein
VFRGNWHSPRFWRWWWHYRATVAARSLVLGVALALVSGGGYAVASSLSQPSGSVVRVVTTVEKVKYVRPRTPDAVADAPLTPPDLRQLVPVQIVRTHHDTTVVTVPLVRTLTVTTRLPSRTVVRTRVAAAPAPKTLTRTVTHEHTRTRTKTVVAHETQTVTNEQNVVSTVVSTNVSTNTVTVSQPVTTTVTRTATQPLPAVTVTRTTTQPVSTTVTVTSTQPVTTTVSQPTTVTTTRTLTTTVTVATTVTVTQPGPPSPPGKGKP